MQKLLLSALVFIAFSAYTFYVRSESFEETGVQVEIPSLISDEHVPTPSIAPAESSGDIVVDPTPSSQTAGQYKDGIYTGDIADAFYGNVQVKAIIKEGVLWDVLILDYPNERQTSQKINAKAVPTLKIEAIRAQSAEVDTVSGATQTSRAFRESLSSALSQARI